MPNPAKPTRLRVKPEERDASGRITRHAAWEIVDGARRVATGCRLEDRAGAERRLAAYIAERQEAARAELTRRERRAADIPVADVIAIYLTDVVARIPDQGQRKRAAGRAKRLLAHWGTKTLADVNGHSCRSYAAARGNDGGARRDLQDLSAAIGHHLEEGYHREIVKVVLPPKGGRRERWLTRSEVARLVWAAWRSREQMRRVHGDSTADRLPTQKRTGQHVARAILFAYYTASRPGDVLMASRHAGSDRAFIDLERGVFYRLPEDKAETSKRQPPTPLGRKILAHCRRWFEGKHCASFVVEWQGRRVATIDTAMTRIAAEAGLGEGVTLYTLRHSRMTHQKQAGIPSWEVAKAAGTSEAMIERHYGHHDPSHLSEAVNATARTGESSGRVGAKRTATKGHSP
jgi:hypothetical protein